MGDIFSGDAPEVKGGEPMFMFKNLPDWMQERYTTGLKGMPTTLDLSYGGGTFPLWYKPFTEGSKQLWEPKGTTPTYNLPGEASPFSSFLMGALPWMGPSTWGSWGNLLGPGTGGAGTGTYSGGGTAGYGGSGLFDDPAQLAQLIAMLGPMIAA